MCCLTITNIDFFVRNINIRFGSEQNLYNKKRLFRGYCGLLNYKHDCCRIVFQSVKILFLTLRFQQTMRFLELTEH